MFVGHYAPALVANAIEPRVPLWLFFVAVQLVDVVWAVLVLLGIEHVRIDPDLPSNPLVLEYMPYTHSLVATVAWAGSAFLVTWHRFGNRGAALVAAAVSSHWLCDLLVHRPDLPLLWTAPKLGMSLWNLPGLAWALEVGMVLAAAWWCARNGVGPPRWTLWVLATTLALVQTAMALGPSLATVSATVMAALAGAALFALLAWRLERIRAT